MGAIPKFVTSRLASEAVGTPGVDTSGQRIAQTVANVSSKAFDTLNAYAVSEANKHITDFEIQLESIIEKNRQANADKPDQLVMGYKTSAKNLLQSTVKNIGSGLVRQSVSNMGQQVIKKKELGELKYQHNQRVSLATSNIEDSINNLAKTAYQFSKSGKTDQVAELYQKLDGVFIAGDSLLSPEQQRALRELGPQSIAKGEFTGLLESNPAEALSRINSGVFDDIFEPEELRSMKNTAGDALKGFDEKIKIETLSREFAGNTELYSGVVSGEVTLGDLEQMEETPFVNKMKAALIKERPKVNPRQAQKVYTELWDRWNQIKGDLKNNKTDATLEQLVRFQNDALQANIDGVLTDSEVKGFQKQLAPTLFKKISEKDGRVRGIPGISDFQPDTIYEAGYQVLTGWLESAGREDDIKAKAALFQNFITAVGDSKLQNIDEGYDLAQKVIYEQVRQENPRVRMLPNAPNAVMKESGKIDILPGKSQLKAQQKVNTPFQIREDAQGNRARVFYDKNNNPVRIEELDGEGNVTSTRDL